MTLVEQVKQAGVVGGGGGSPTHVKLAANADAAVKAVAVELHEIRLAMALGGIDVGTFSEPPTTTGVWTAVKYLTERPYAAELVRRLADSTGSTPKHFQVVVPPPVKAKKKRLNARRPGRQVLPAQPPQPAGDLPRIPPDPQAGAAPASEPLPASAQLRPEGVAVDESSVAQSPMLPYVRMIVSLIAGVAFTCREVVRWLRRAVRQHSIGAHIGRDYLLAFRHQRPP